MNRQDRRDHLRQICRAGIDAVCASCAMERDMALEGDRLKVGPVELDLGAYRRILVIGTGKAAAAMARHLEGMIGERIDEGFVTVKYGHSVPLERIKVREAGHPIPDQNGLNAAKETVASFPGKMSEDTLVFCLLSGGGSVLWPLPVKGIKLRDLQDTNEQLLRSGADITQINAVRKHLSAIKGGWLAAMLAPSRVVSLIISDIPGNPVDQIASGPTSPDETTFADAKAICDRFGLKVTDAVRERLEDGVSGKIPDTPKPGDPVFDRVSNVLVADNTAALAAAAEKARELGYEPVIVNDRVTGETQDLAQSIVNKIRTVKGSGSPAAPPACLLWGGETTHKVTASGLGGRCTHTALIAALAMARLDPGIAADAGMMSSATDGSDGPTSFSGAFADAETVEIGKAEGLDAEEFLATCNAAGFFDKIGDVEATGPTLTNVMDIHALLVGVPGGG